MALPKENLLTTDYIYLLPEGERAELIDGQVYTMVNNYIKLKNGHGVPFIAPYAVFLNQDDKTYVEPDISVICNLDKLNHKGCQGVLDCGL